MTELAAETPRADAPVEYGECEDVLVRDLVADRKVLHLPTRTTVREAAEFMTLMHMGAIPVLHDGVLEGIFTERDALNRVLAKGADPERTLVGDVMTRDPICIGLTATAREARAIMQSQAIRHLLVVEQDQVVGIISLRDLII